MNNFKCCRGTASRTFPRDAHRAARSRRTPTAIVTLVLCAMAPMPFTQAASDVFSDDAKGVRANPTAAAATAEWSGAPTVEALLQLDAQAALRAERTRIDRLLAIVRPSSQAQGTSRAAADAGDSPSGDAVVLNAVYGVGVDLTAEVTIAGQRQRMRALAARRGDDEARDGIVRIDRSRECVVVRRAGVERSVCLAKPSTQPMQEVPGVLPDALRATPLLLQAGGAR